MSSELMSYVKGNENLQNLKYSGYAIKFLEEMSLGFDYIYKKVSDELDEKKDTELSDRLSYAQKILNKYSEEELRAQFSTINQKYIQYAEINSEFQLLSFFDEVKEIPFFSLADRSIGNRHMYSFFNKHLRNLVRSMDGSSDEKLRVTIESILENTTKYMDAERNGIGNLIAEINSASKELIKVTLDKYYKIDADRSVNSFRRKVLVDLLSDIKLTQETVDEQVVYLKSEGIHNWKSFSLVAGLHYYLFNLQASEIELESMITEIFNNAELNDEYIFRKVFTQKGAQNYGSGYVGVCFLKQQFKASQTNQLVFEISDKVCVKFYNSILKNSLNETIINIDSATLVQDITSGFIHASEVFYDNEVVLENREEVHSQMRLGKIIEKGSYLNDHKQLIIDGAPGTGKSYGVNTEVKEKEINHERVTFYSDYEYHNFIGSILPKLSGETVTYEFVKGPFTKILNDALSQPEDRHYLIVEELTRGNAAAIFGDIFQLLDRTEEGWSEYPITHDNILESLNPEVRTFLENEYEGKVVLPPNLSIICTINSSDQNVYPLDTAFKRRFDYKIESTDVHDGFDDYDIKFGTYITVSWQDFYQKLNQYILVDLGLKEDKQVGPYFIKNHKDDIKKLESIQTKLAMYMWNDLHKVHTISNKTIFKDIHALYEVDNLFRTGSREQILKVLSTEFKQHFNLNN